MGRQMVKQQDAGLLDAAWLKQVARDCGADDVGLVELDRSALDDQRHFILQTFAATRSLLSFVIRMNREPIRSPVRSVANEEFHAGYDDVNATAREIVRVLEERGVPVCNAVAAFPMEAQLPGRTWTVAHKPVAVAAGLGQIGLPAASSIPALEASCCSAPCLWGRRRPPMTSPSTTIPA